MEQIFFIGFAVLAIVSALAVVSLRNPVHSALCLMVCLFQVACIFVLLRSPFLAVVQIFIYVGAVMVLFLFVVMILDIRKVMLGSLVGKRSGFVYAIMPLVTLEFLLVIFKGGLGKVASNIPSGEEVKVAVIGKELFTKYLFPFEVVSILLLVAMVGAIVLAKDRDEGA
ncbi:MAG: NADH-quinone oxidoreductase subunit J [Deltaproteobacteria bacterium]|nr:NADH-quinone oxidoreductase subunit J [Deltaproteobacteria bacterium]